MSEEAVTCYAITAGLADIELRNQVITMANWGQIVGPAQLEAYCTAYENTRGDPVEAPQVSMK